MIVKTGANYQAEGGYIEASEKGSFYTLTNNDKILAFGGSEELGPFIVPVTIVNETGRELMPTCMFPIAGGEYVFGMPYSNNIGVGETKTINCLGIIGLPMRISYSGSGALLKCESEYMNVEIIGTGEKYTVFTIVKMPENGEPITARLYI